MRVVTIDGPAGAGKSTVSRRLAERLGWRLLDTGAMYRAVALAALRAGVDLADDQQVGKIAERVTVRLQEGRVLLDEEDVSETIRSVEVTKASSVVARGRRVRARLKELQRSVAAQSELVAEGRDLGTVVFPNAPCKFFLTATLEERARRRHAELAARGQEIDLETVRTQVAERDVQDESRSESPLRQAPDALLIDTSRVGLDDVLAEVERIVRARFGLTEGSS